MEAEHLEKHAEHVSELVLVGPLGVEDGPAALPADGGEAAGGVDEHGVAGVFEQGQVGGAVGVAPAMGAILVGELSEAGNDFLHGGDLGFVLVVAGDESGHAGKFGADLETRGDAVVKAESVSDLVRVEVGAGGVQHEHAVLVLMAKDFGAQGWVGPFWNADFGELAGVGRQACAGHAAQVA